MNQNRGIDVCHSIQLDFQGIRSRYQLWTILNKANLEFISKAAEIAKRSDEWLIYQHIRIFLDDPSPKSLAELLCKISSDIFSSEYAKAPRLPWIVNDCLLFCNSPEDLRVLASRVSQGELGDLDSWLAAEKRWASRGVTVDDLTHPVCQGLPFNSMIGEIGIPYSLDTYLRTTASMSPGKLLSTHNSDWLRIPVEKIKYVVSPFLDYTFFEFCYQFDPRLLREILESSSRNFFSFDLWLPRHTRFPDDEWTLFFNWLGESGRFLFYSCFRFEKDLIIFLQNQFLRNQNMVGLLWLLAGGADENTIVDIPERFLEIRKDRPRHIRLAIAMIRLTLREIPLHEGQIIAEETANILNTDATSIFKALVFGTVSQLVRSEATRPVVVQFLVYLHLNCHDALIRGQCSLFLRKSLELGASDLQDPFLYSKLKLPEQPSFTEK